MKTHVRRCGASLMLFLAAIGMAAGKGEGDGANGTDTLLAEIASAVDSYRSKTVTLRLRLKRVDVIFEKIIFYDRKNHDIEFDMSSREIKKRLSADMLNIHEGVVYLVTFTVRDRGNLGEVIGDLLGFRPAFLDAVPGGG
ncbi:MAG: hypothetical protein E4G96_08325 [Chrysiogenales bacterium]|nr:MAG: hypothetical protein E4G96_08325 [Chrysiogenales bacterium]